MALTLDPSKRNDIIIRQGQSLNFSFLLTNESDGEDFAVAGYTFNLEIYDRRRAKIFDLTDGEGLTVQDGSVAVSISANDLNIPDGDYKYFLVVTNPDAETNTWINGYAKVKDSLSIGSQDDVSVTVSNADNNVNITVGISGSTLSAGDQTKIDNLPENTTQELAGKADKAVTEVFSQTILFDKNKEIEVTQSGEINLTLSETGNVPNTFIYLKIIGDGANNINISDDFNVKGEIDYSTTNHLYFHYTSFGEANLVILKFTKIVSGNNAPIASNVVFSADNTNVGDQATLAYTYSDSEGDAENNSSSGSIYKIYRYNTEQDANGHINAQVIAQGPTLGGLVNYEFDLLDETKFLRASVVPRALTGTEEGDETLSGTIGPIGSLFEIESLGSSKLLIYLQDGRDSNNVTLDTTGGTTTVSEWLDSSGNNRHFSQATKLLQPSIDPSEGIIFTAHRLVRSFSFSGKLLIVEVSKINEGVQSARFLDMSGVNRCLFQFSNMSKQLFTYSTSESINIPGWELGTINLCVGLFDGANSFMQRNNLAPVAGTLGAININTINMGDNGSGGNQGNFSILEVVFMDADQLEEGDLDNVINALRVKYSIWE